MPLFGVSPSTQRHPITHWVTFRGESSVFVRASGNVSSITDRGTGYYGVNFSTSMPDTNYCIFGNTVKGDANNDGKISSIDFEILRKKKYGGKINYRMTGGQVVDSSYD